MKPLMISGRMNFCIFVFREGVLVIRGCREEPGHQDLPEIEKRGKPTRWLGSSIPWLDVLAKEI
jgi:hypothetical protein